MNYRECGVTTLLGEVIYERAYYHCAHCHHGFFPTDDEFRLTDKKTPGATEVMALMGLLEPFAEAANSALYRLTGLNVSPSTVQRTTEAVGEQVAQQRSHGATIGPEEAWNWHPDATGKTVAYIGLDATGVRQQGPHAERAEGRMPWVGVIFNPDLQSQPRQQLMWDSRYVAGLLSLEDIGKQLRRECEAVGIDKADLVIALSDGGNGIENCLTDVLGGLANEFLFILDFWHAAEHVQEFAKLLIADENARREQVTAWCQQLKHEGGAALLVTLTGLDLSRASPQTTENHHELTGYLCKNLHRTDYPTYVKNGWQIGSGKVESACKSIVATRLKGPGMRWRQTGTTALCQLRALYKSNLWPHYWKSTNYLTTYF